MWLGLVGARLHHGTIGPPVGARLRRRAPMGPDCAVGRQLGPDCAVGPRRDCAVTLSFALQSYNAASSSKPGFWEGVVLLGISPELFFLGGGNQQQPPQGMGPG